MTYAIHRRNHGCKYTPTFFFLHTYIYIIKKYIILFDGDFSDDLFAFRW